MRLDRHALLLAAAGQLAAEHHPEEAVAERLVQAHAQVVAPEQELLAEHLGRGEALWGEKGGWKGVGGRMEGRGEKGKWKGGEGGGWEVW